MRNMISTLVALTVVFALANVVVAQDETYFIPATDNVSNESAEYFAGKLRENGVSATYEARYIQYYYSRENGLQFPVIGLNATLVSEATRDTGIGFTYKGARARVSRGETAQISLVATAQKPKGRPFGVSGSYKETYNNLVVSAGRLRLSHRNNGHLLKETNNALDRLAFQLAQKIKDNDQPAPARVAAARFDPPVAESITFGAGDDMSEIGTPNSDYEPEIKIPFHDSVLFNGMVISVRGQGGDPSRYGFKFRFEVCKTNGRWQTKLLESYTDSYDISRSDGVEIEND